jgi:hypothetical protein
MIWVTWRQHRTQAVVCLALFCAVAIAAVALGAWMRATFSSDGLGACLARSGGAGCPGVITSFTQKFSGPAMVPLGILLVAIPGYLGAVVGAPLLGQELERGTWQLAWSQTVPRTRWLVTQLALVMGGLAVFGAAVTAVVTWARAPLDEVSVRAQPPLNFEGVFLTCSLLCAFALGVLAGLLLRNTIGAMVVAYIAWEVPFLLTTLLSGPLRILATTRTIACATGCAQASANSVPPVTGNLGDQVLSLTRTGNHLNVTYLPASRFWTLQLIDAGVFLAVAAAALGTAIWLLHRRTT